MQYPWIHSFNLFEKNNGNKFEFEYDIKEANQTFSSEEDCSSFANIVLKNSILLCSSQGKIILFCSLLKLSYF